jgi:hypothetical protein
MNTLPSKDSEEFHQLLASIKAGRKRDAAQQVVI